MSVKELIEQLQKLSPEQEVFLSSDEEGNSIYEIFEVAMYEHSEAGDTSPVIFPSHRLAPFVDFDN